MEKIKIVFLGTSNAIPTKERNHTAILLNYKNESILIDCGEGTQRQFRLADISPTKLTRILITHWHGDHILGLSGLFQTLAMNNYQKTLFLYGPRGTKHDLSLLNELVKIKIPLSSHEVGGRFLETPEFIIEASAMKHSVPTNAYAFVVKEKRRLDKKKLRKLKLPNSPLIGKLQKGEDISISGKIVKASHVSYIEKGRKIVIILDTLYDKNAIQLARNADLLICESSFSDEEKAQAREYKHLTAAQAATIAKKAGVKHLILTHISQRYEHDFSKIKKEATQIFKKITIARDLQSFEI